MILPEELESIAFLKNLEVSHANQIALVMELKECPPGNVLFREGQECPYIYFVLRGSVNLEIEEPPGKGVQIQTVERGQLLGWSPVLGLGPMTATAVTADWSRIAALAIDRLQLLCDSDPRFGMAVMRQLAIALAQRLRTTRERLSRNLQEKHC
jgi:CRP-like cAMP-binding protein